MDSILEKRGQKYSGIMLRRNTFGLMFISLILSACGGGGDSGSPDSNPASQGDTNNSGSSREVSDSDFYESIKASGSGVWRITHTIDTTYMPLQDVTVVTDTRGVSPVAYTVGNAGIETYEVCDGLGPQANQNAAVPVDENFCANGGVGTTGELKYYEIDDSHLRLQAYCDGKLFSQTEFEKISNTPAFNLGSLSLSSTTFQPLNNSTQVCGSLSSLDTQVTQTTQAAPNPALDALNQTFSSISVVAPYLDSFIRVDMQIYRKDVVVGSYTVIDSIVGASASNVSVKLSSSEFGGTLENPAVLSAVSGGVTINSVSSNATSGSLDVMTNTGEHIQGNFTVDIN